MAEDKKSFGKQLLERIYPELYNNPTSLGNQLSIRARRLGAASAKDIPDQSRPIAEAVAVMNATLVEQNELLRKVVQEQELGNALMARMSGGDGSDTSWLGMLENAAEGALEFFAAKKVVGGVRNFGRGGKSYKPSTNQGSVKIGGKTGSSSDIPHETIKGIESTFGEVRGTLGKMLKGSIKGGLIAGVLEFLGETAIDTALPLDSKAQAYKDESIPQRFADLYRSMGGRASVRAPTASDFPDAGQLERSRRSRLVWHNGSWVDDPEAARGRALNRLPVNPDNSPSTGSTQGSLPIHKSSYSDSKSKSIKLVADSITFKARETIFSMREKIYSSPGSGSIGGSYPIQSASYTRDVGASIGGNVRSSTNIPGIGTVTSTGTPAIAPPSSGSGFQPPMAPVTPPAPSSGAGSGFATPPSGSGFRAPLAPVAPPAPSSGQSGSGFRTPTSPSGATPSAPVSTPATPTPAAPAAPFRLGEIKPNGVEPEVSSDYAGLNLKGAQAVRGGTAQQGLIDVARALQKADPRVMFSALNDEYHKAGGGSGPLGAHGQGRAFDAVMPNIEGDKAILRKQLTSMGFQEGAWGSGKGDFSFEPGSAGGTGPHMHFQWNNVGAAARYHAAINPKGEPSDQTRIAASGLTGDAKPSPSETTASGWNKDNTYVIGDSWGAGIKSSMGSQGTALVGANPTQVLGMINGQSEKTPQGRVDGIDPAALKGKNVVLSPGLLNGPNQIAQVKKQIEALNKMGVTNDRIRLVSPNVSPDVKQKGLLGVHDQVEGLAKQLGIQTVSNDPKNTGGYGGYHPGDYSDLVNKIESTGARVTTQESSSPVTQSMGEKAPGGMADQSKAALYAEKMVGLRVGVPEERDKLHQYMREAGIDINPETTAWCSAGGAASLVRAGIKVPKNPEYAPNWENWGHAVDPKDIKAGDVLLRMEKNEKTGKREAGHMMIATGAVIPGNPEMARPPTAVTIGSNTFDPNERKEWEAHGGGKDYPAGRTQLGMQNFEGAALDPDIVVRRANEADPHASGAPSKAAQAYAEKAIAENKKTDAEYAASHPTVKPPKVNAETDHKTKDATINPQPKHPSTPTPPTQASINEKKGNITSQNMLYSLCGDTA